MFVRLRDFKRLIKEAYTGAGLYVARRGNQLLFGGSYWAIATMKESLDKKALAAVIELTGEMPEDGGGFQGNKGSQPVRDQRSTLEFDRHDIPVRIRDRGTVYQSAFSETGILEKRSNNPDCISFRPRRYERKRSSGLFAERKDRRIRRNGHGV